MTALFLRFLKVSARPTPPPGAGESFALFNPSKKLLLLNWIRWLFKQFWTLVGVVFSLAFLGAVDLPSTLQSVDAIADRVRAEVPLDRPIEVNTDSLSFSTDIKLGELLRWVETVAIGGFLIQLVVSGFLVNLRWRMHWYMVSDRILGIRKGLGRVDEQTMTIANVQNMKIKQGPIQRLFGISDLEVHTAGGASSSSSDPTTAGKQLHVGLFEGLDDAEGLRETIRRTLARTKTAGLGDPDDVEELVGDCDGDVSTASSTELEALPWHSPQSGGQTSMIAAASNGGVLEEARGFRHEVQRACRAAEKALTRLEP